jgi:hypothetical protein
MPYLVRVFQVDALIVAFVTRSSNQPIPPPHSCSAMPSDIHIFSWPCLCWQEGLPHAARHKGTLSFAQ